MPVILKQLSGHQNAPLFLDWNFRSLAGLKRVSKQIVLDLVIELADSGQHSQCTALIDMGAMGLYIDHAYVTCIETQLESSLYRMLTAPRTKEVLLSFMLTYS
jgi:hypothetical protein